MNNNYCEFKISKETVTKSTMGLLPCFFFAILVLSVFSVHINQHCYFHVPDLAALVLRFPLRSIVGRAHERAVLKPRL